MTHKREISKKMQSNHGSISMGSFKARLTVDEGLTDSHFFGKDKIQHFDSLVASN